MILLTMTINIKFKIRNIKIMKNKFLLVHLLLMTGSIIASENESFRSITKGFQHTENTLLTKKTIQYDKDRVYKIDANKTNNPFKMQMMHEISSKDINHRVIKTRPSALAYALVVGTALTGAYLYGKIKFEIRNVEKQLPKQ